MSDLERLLPCPFCGGSGHHYYDEGQGYYVACTRCGACGIVRHNDNAAAKEWNTRAPTAKQEVKDE